MEELLKELATMIHEGSLQIEGVIIGNSGYEIELGKDADAFDGEIKLRVTSTWDVIELGNRLGKAMKDV